MQINLLDSVFSSHFIKFSNKYEIFIFVFCPILIKIHVKSPKFFHMVKLYFKFTIFVWLFIV